MFSLPWVITGRFFGKWRRVRNQTSILEVPAPSIIIARDGGSRCLQKSANYLPNLTVSFSIRPLYFKRPRPCFSSQNDPLVTSFPRRWRCVLWPSASWLRGDGSAVVIIRNVDGVMSLKSTIWICTLLSVVGHPMVLLSVLCFMVVAARLLHAGGSRRKRLAEYWKWKNFESRWIDSWLAECFL